MSDTLEMIHPITYDKDIKIGDRVEVHWEFVRSVRGVVLYIPMSEGDFWKVKDDLGALHYIQRFSVMRRVDEKEKVT